MSAQQAIAEARCLIGTPWRHRGRSPWGLDCIGLIVRALRVGGAPVRDRTDYGREPWRDGLQQELAAQFQPVDWADAQAGDVVLLRWATRPEPGHVGLLTEHPAGGWALIHCYSQSAVIEHRLGAQWRALVVGLYRPEWP